MNNFGKLVSVLLCVTLILSIMCFVSCSDNQNSGDNGDDPVTEPAKYSVGLSLFGSPYVYSVEDKVSGICVDILANIASKNNEDLELKVVDSEAIITGLMNDEYDAALAPVDTRIDEKIAEELIVSQTVVSNKFVILVSDSSKIYRLYDLAIMSSKKVGILDGSAAMENAVSRFGEENVISYPTYEDGVAAVNAGEINAIIVDERNSKIINDEYIAENNLKLLADDYYSVNYVVFIKDTNSEVQRKTNNALATLEAEKKIEAIVNEYILGDGTAN